MAGCCPSRRRARRGPRTWSSPRYQQQARELAGQAGLQGRLDWRLHDLAEDPGAVAPADLVVLHRVVCCYPAYERLLAAAADHARCALVFSYPPHNLISRAFYRVFNLMMRLTRSSFAGLPTRWPRCWRCWRITCLGGPTGPHLNLADHWPGAHFVRRGTPRRRYGN